MHATQVELTLDYPDDRLDRALAAAMPDLSRMQWQRLIKEGRVLVNGRSAKPSLKLEGGEKIWADIPEAIESDLIPEAMDLDIRYEDDDFLVVNKPAGMVVHPGTGHESGTLVHGLLAHCPDLPGIGDTKRPGIVHRLDKDTSGLLAVAKNDLAMRHLQAQFAERTVGKQYLALTHGHIQPLSAIIDAPIGRDPKQRKKMAVIPPGGSATARAAQTKYHTITSFDEYTLVGCDLYTGRTHQIRVHLAYIGYPIVGDRVYGRRKQTLLTNRHFLHAAELKLKRPSDNQEMAFSAELPQELQTILEKVA